MLVLNYGFENAKKLGGVSATEEENGFVWSTDGANSFSLTENIYDVKAPTAEEIVEGKVFLGYQAPLMYEQFEQLKDFKIPAESPFELYDVERLSSFTVDYGVVDTAITPEVGKFLILVAGEKKLAVADAAPAATAAKYYFEIVNIDPLQNDGRNTTDACQVVTRLAE
jgi:hypothetical protein